MSANNIFIYLYRKYIKGLPGIRTFDISASKKVFIPKETSEYFEIHNGLCLMDLLPLLKNKNITVIELSENTHTIYEGQANNFICSRSY